MEDIIEPAESKHITIDLETKSQPQSQQETKSQSPSHNGKQIDQMVVSPDMSYVVTYSKDDNSILGWSVDIEKDGPQQPDVEFSLGDSFKISSFVLYKKILLFYHEVTNKVNKAKECHYRLVDLNGEGQFIELDPKIDSVGENSMGFLPNGDLILVLLEDCKICVYSMPSNSKPSAPWKCAQKYDIEIPKCLNYNENEHNIDEYINCSVYQTVASPTSKTQTVTKLFISTTTKFHKYDSVTMIAQWNLSKTIFDFEMQYNLSDSYKTMSLDKSLTNIVINKNQTLLALNIKEVVYVFSMETGIQISRYLDDYEPIEFATLKDGSEGLIIHKKLDKKSSCKFIDPFSEYITISDDNNTSNDNDITTSDNNDITASDDITASNDITTSDDITAFDDITTSDDITAPDDITASDDITVSDDITDIINDPKNNIITKSNRKIFIIENNVHIADGLREDSFQRLLNQKIYHRNIYTSSIFKTIRNMLENIKDNNINKMDKIGSEASGELFRFRFINDDKGDFVITGFKNPNDENKETRNHDFHKTTDILSYQTLNNQDFALITKQGIFIYTIDGDLLGLRYFWNNNEWKDKYNQNESNEYNQRKSNKYNQSINEYEQIIEHEQDSSDDIIEYQKLIEKVLNNEFSDSLSSIPSPNFKFIFENYDINLNNTYEGLIKPFNLYKNLLSSIIMNDLVEFSRFGAEILKIAIEKNCDYIVQLIFDKIFKLIEDDKTNYMMLLPIVISLNLPKLCDHHYSYLVMKYILYTSIIFDPTCLSVKNSENITLHAYSRNIHIKKSNIYHFNLFKSLKSFHKSSLTVQEEKIPKISFIVLFPQICKYPNNSWNDFLCKPKSIIFCNVDNFYKWWNFAAIIDFKWNSFGKYYYCWIWFFYTICFLCFAIASTFSIPDPYRMILFIISIIYGSIHLIFEFRQFLWKPKIYITDIWNLFDVAAYFLPIITFICWLTKGESPFFTLIAAISNLILNFKFLLFFRVRESFGIYFAIIIGVARNVFSFLMILFFIVFGFAHAFYILLRSTDPWNLTTTYNSVNPNQTTLIQKPDSNTNMFNWFPTALLAMYLFLTGDSGSLSSWTYREFPAITILSALFMFFTVIYLMNLFIGLLNMGIEDHNKYEEFLLQKAQIITEIELFYMLSYQRNNNIEWFPDWIYYDISVHEVRKLINAIDDNKSEFEHPLFISNKLRELIKIPIPKGLIDDQKNDEDDKLEMVVKEDEEKAFELIVKLADRGNVDSQCHLAIAYENGKGTKKDLNVALKWYKKAAKNGDVNAMCSLAEHYKNGKEIIENNLQEAFNWYKKAAESGSENAMYNLANCYENGKGTKLDLKDAFKWYQKAAKNGKVSAMYSLAEYYKNGKETEKNLEEAFNWYKKAAEKGNENAMYNLAICYKQGEGIEKNLEEAYIWYRKAAENGHKTDDITLAIYYEEKNNFKEAFKSYQKAADNGNENAMYNLANCYKNSKGTEENLKEAFNWYKKAAENDHINAMYNLANCYKNGEGTYQYIYDAFNWYKKAAENGHKNAMYDLANCYINGEGTVKNLDEALNWHEKAAGNDHEGTEKNLAKKFLENKCKLEYGRTITSDEIKVVEYGHTITSDEIKVANKKAFIIDEITDFMTAEECQKGSIKNEIDIIALSFIDNIDVHNLVEFGFSIGRLNSKSETFSTLNYNCISKVSLKLRLKPTEEFIHEVEEAIVSNNPIENFKMITERFGRFISEEIILGGRAYFKESTRDTKYQLIGEEQPSSYGSDEKAWIETLKVYTNWDCLKFKKPVSIFQLLPEDIRDRIFKSVGKRILYLSNDTIDYTFNEHVKLEDKIPQYISNIIQTENADCNTFATVFDTAESDKDVFNCLIISNEQSLMIRCIQQNTEKSEYKLNIGLMVIGYDTNFDFIHSGFDVKLEVRKNYVSVYSNVKYGEIFLDCEYNEKNVCFGISELYKLYDWNKNKLIAHHFFKNDDNKIGIYLFAYNLENGHYDELPNTTFHTLTLIDPSSTYCSFKDDNKKTKYISTNSTIENIRGPIINVECCCGNASNCICDKRLKDDLKYAYFDPFQDELIAYMKCIGKQLGDLQDL